MMACALPVMLLTRWRVELSRHLPLLIAGILTAVSTDFGRALLARLTEYRDARSSTSLRALEAYQLLLPQWLVDPAGMAVGWGAGAARLVAARYNIGGLVVPNPLKSFFDFGFIGGCLLMGVMVVMFLRGPAPAIAVALAASWMFLQGASMPFLVCILVTTSLWASPSVRTPPSALGGSIDLKHVRRSTAVHRHQP